MAGTLSPGPFSAPSTEQAASWLSRGSPVERARLVAAYTPLVRRLAARHFSRWLGSELEFGDLMQLGAVGLLEAIDRYAPERGVRFETFATYRIEGAILNGLPSYSEYQRQLAVRRDLICERTESIRTSDGEDGKPALEQLADLAIGLALGFALDDEHDQQEEPSEPDNAYARVELAQLRRQLSDLVNQLHETERRVIFGHYFQLQPFEEIARDLTLTKGRISQLHHAALRRLRERFRAIRGNETLA